MYEGDPCSPFVYEVLAFIMCLLSEDSPANRRRPPKFVLMLASVYNIRTMLVQRRRRWADVVQLLYKCFVFVGIVSVVCTAYFQSLDGKASSMLLRPADFYKQFQIDVQTGKEVHCLFASNQT